VKSAQLVEQFPDVRRFHQNVVMIRQDTSREHLAGAKSKLSQQIAAKIIHAFQGSTNHRMMLKTCCGNQEAQVTEIGAMRRRMPWIAALLPPDKQLFSLLGRKLTPKV
jgi:hypothetical protein